MLRAPWIKRIDLATGEATAHALEPTAPFPTAPEVAGLSSRFEFDGEHWHHLSFTARAPATPIQHQRQWARHGVTVASPTHLFVFMEYPEARHAQLEASLGTDPAAVSVYADWLEEQGDPYAASLKPQLLAARGPAGKWFLEGLDRSGRVVFELREALVHRATLSVLFDELEATLHRLVHLRACLTLKEVAITEASFRHAQLMSSSPREIAAWPVWRRVRWPASLQTLRLPGDLEHDEARALEEQLGGRVRLAHLQR